MKTCPLTLINMNDIGMLHRGHDLHLPPDTDQISLRLYLALLNRLDGYLLTSLLVNT